MANEELLRERRRRWAECATNGTLLVREGLITPKMSSIDGEAAYTFCGVGIELMLRDTGQQWNDLGTSNGQHVANETTERNWLRHLATMTPQDYRHTIENTTERMCEHYGLAAYAVNELFGDSDDIQFVKAEELARQLLEYEIVGVEAGPATSEDAPSLIDLAGYAYYDHEGWLQAVAIQHPAGGDEHQCYLAGNPEGSIIDGAEPHHQVFKMVNARDGAPLTVMPIFWSPSLRVTVADRMAVMVRCARDEQDDTPVADMLNRGVCDILVGDFGPYTESPFQPPSRLRYD